MCLSSPLEDAQVFPHGRLFSYRPGGLVTHTCALCPVPTHKHTQHKAPDSIWATEEVIKPPLCAQWIAMCWIDCLFCPFFWSFSCICCKLIWTNPELMGGVGIVGFDPRGGKGKIKNLSLSFQRLNSIYNPISYFDCRANTKQQDQHLLLETCGCGTQTTRSRGLMSGCGKVIYMDICASSLGGTITFSLCTA